MVNLAIVLRKIAIWLEHDNFGCSSTGIVNLAIVLRKVEIWLEHSNFGCSSTGIVNLAIVLRKMQFGWNTAILIIILREHSIWL
jgi:hypothetical protein